MEGLKQFTRMISVLETGRKLDIERHEMIDAVYSDEAGALLAAGLGLT